MATRQALHHLIDELPEGALETAWDLLAPLHANRVAGTAIAEADAADTNDVVLRRC